MDLKNFDKKIKSALDSIEAPYEPGSWASLEQRMNDAITEEQPSAVEPVDLVVKRSLERLDVAYSASDWSLLNTRLNQLAMVRRIRITKLAEVAIFLLLLINIQGFLGGFKEVLKPKAPQLPKSSVPMASNLNVKKSRLHASPSNSSNSGSLVEKVVALLASPFQSAVVSENPNTQNLPVILANKSVLDASNFYTTSGLVPFHKIAPLPQTKQPEFAWNTFFDIIPGVSVPAPYKANGFYAGGFASYDNNYIKSTGKATAQNSFGGGIAVGYRKGGWGIETGVAYSNKSFTPNRSVEVFAGNPIIGTLGAFVKDVNADVFSVPVKATRRFARVGRTQAFAVAGITTYVATEKRYGYKLVSNPATSPDPVPGPNPKDNPIPQRNNNGYLEGGSLRSNSYATADLGLRLEHSLGKRFVAFVEPTYRQSMGGGFGPNRERINSLTIQAGVMASL